MLIENFVCDNNRRQGLSITLAENVTVSNCTFKNTIGTSPQSGLDIEPNVGCHVKNVAIKICQFVNNVGWGLIINGANGLSVSVINIDSCLFFDNSRIGVTATNTSVISYVIPAGTTKSTTVSSRSAMG